MVDILKEMQEEELQAIQAIYMDDYVCHTTGTDSPEISLKLTPLQSIVEKDVHARLELRVKYTTRYPNDPPALKLENAKGISNEQLSTLKDELDKMALELCGEVMVLQLAQHTQSFLHEYNVPSLSFFEQMVANQQKQEELYFQEQQKLKEAKVAEDLEHDQDVIRKIKEELQKRGEVIKEEKRKRQISLSQQSSPLNSSYSQNVEAEPQRKEKFICLKSKDRKLTVLTFKNKTEERKVFCSSCVGHYFDGACCLTAIDELTGKQMSVCEWKVKLQTQKKKVEFADKQDTLLKQIQSIEQEFNFLKTKILCNGLLNYHNLDIDLNANNLTARLLLDPINGTSLSSCLNEDGLPISIIQSLCKQILEVLAYLHNKSVLHRDLNLLNTFINANNEVMISGYAVTRRISDFCKLLNTSNNVEPPLPSSFDDYRKVIKCGKKGDIFNLGLILLSLHQGHTNIGFPPTIPEAISKPFKSFLHSCLSKEPLTIQQLSRHAFLQERFFDNPTVLTNEKDKQPAKDKDLNNQYVPMPVLLGDAVLVGRSRLRHEFEIMQWLGKGGFGSVLKVRNKLDGNLYAIKRIPLNPKSLHLNKRITREVKLLSRLNHENVVRYFNSWIEAEDIELPEGNISNTDDYTTPPNKKEVKINIPQKKDLEESLLQLHNIDDDGNNLVRSDDEDISWCDSTSKLEVSTETSSSEEEEENPSELKRRNVLIRSRSTRGESSEGIVFQMNDSMVQFGDMLDSEDSEEEANPTTTATTTTTTTTDTGSDISVTLQYLYIQMEFCDKNTLRNVIDEGLHKEPDRVMKLFREIVEGLAHVHAQGIIHRDLKPFNIFMDSAERIKIGDFGLATSHTSTRVDTNAFLAQDESMNSATDDRMTGKVGTALYVAPELGEAKSRIRFSQKVDLYSLGVILFEMFYRPLNTGMERVKTIGLLRTKDIIFPDDFCEKKHYQEKYLISWLLNHNPESRPTAQELLESGYVPPKIEDRQLDELLKHTLSQNNSTRYQRLMSAMFAQTISPVSDQIYDSDCHGNNEAIIIQWARLLQHVQSCIKKIFLKHGAVFIETPLLIPKSKIFDNLNVATFLDSSGLQLCLPYDSRINFARYIARNNISNLRRFYFGKLYRQKLMVGAHPIGIWECSFDIVSDSYSSLLPHAEVIYTVCEIIKEFPRVSSRNYYLRLNHLNIVKALFVQNKFSEDVQQSIYRILETTRNKKERESLLHEYFLQLDLSEHVITKLLSFLTFEGSITKAKETLQSLRKSKASVSALAKQAFYDLDRVLKHLNNFNVDIPVYICTSLVPSVLHYSGIVFQFVAENIRKRKYGGVDILAVGGCYDQLIESMSRYAETSDLPTSVGVSVAVEKILMAVFQEEEENNDLVPSYSSQCDAIVCSVTNTPNLGALVQTLDELWSANIRATLFSYEVNQDYTVEEILDHCNRNGINHVVILKESDLEYVRVKSREKDKFLDTRVLRKELCDHLNQRLSTKTDVTKDVEQVFKNVNVEQNTALSLLFTFYSWEKIELNKKRKYENIFVSKFKQELQQCFGNNELQIVVTSLLRTELKSVAAYLELNGSHDEFESSVRVIMEMYKDQGQSMKRLCNTLYKVYKESNTVVVLYSYIAEIYKVFT